MNTRLYRIGPETLDWPRLAPVLDAVGDALSRLDERLRKSPIADGIVARSHVHEAAGTLLTGGELVLVEDIVLFDAGAQNRMSTPEIARARTILAARRQAERTKPSDLFSDDGFKALTGQRASGREWERSALVYDLDHDEDSLLDRFSEVFAWSQNLPPLLAAAVVFDAWRVLEPIQFQGWRAFLLAAAVLKARGRVRHHLPVPAWGYRHARYRVLDVHDPTTRLLGFLDWLAHGADAQTKELDRLTIVSEVVGLILRERRRQSRLPALVDLFLSSPVVTPAMVAKKLDVTPQGAQKLIDQLGSSARELTGRSRYRVYGL